MNPEVITLDQFEPTTPLDAAHIINDDTNELWAVIRQPEDRARFFSGEYPKADWDEEAFREAVRAIVRAMDPGHWYIAWHPGTGREYDDDPDELITV